MSGSSDFYKPQHRLPINSINFVTCHDGFTLYDLFSYNEKHNEANGEDNRDGHNENLSFNHGVEGETDDPGILAQRSRQAKNAIAILLLSQGVPMLLAGDEVLNTQNGNNNGYCQNNELTWFDWRLLQTNADMLRFVRHMIALRKRHPCLRRRRFLSGSPVNGRDIPDVSWHGIDIGAPLWHDPDAQVLAFTLAAVAEGEADVHVMLNLSDTDIDMELPAIQGRELRLALNTALAAPEDIVSPEDQKPFGEKRYPVGARTVLVFEAVAV